MSGRRLLVLTDRVSGRGGADRHLWDVVAALRARGHAVRVAAGRVEAGGQAEVRCRALASPVATDRQLERLDPHLAQAEVLLVQNVMNPAALARLSATGRAVVLVQDHRVFCPGPGRTLPDGRACDRPPGDAACAACLPDAAYRARTLALTAARRAALAGARLVVLSDYMRRELGEGTVLPPWLAVDAAPADGPRDRIVLAGRLVSHKDVHTAVAAWSAAGRPLPLHVAGEGPVPTPGAVRHGWLARPALWALLRRARAVLFPARWQEPFGILGVEALACGAPVVVAEVGGVADWAQAGCVRVPPGDAAAMAAALGRLCADPTAAAALGAAGQAVVRRTFARAPLLARWEALLEAVATGAAPAPGSRPAARP